MEEENKPKRESYANGVPSWVDFGATDIETAKRFYSELFGWEWTGTEMPQGGGMYWTASRGGDDVAGAVAFPPNAEMGSVWNTCVNVNSVDRALEKAIDCGAIIVMPAGDVGDAGRFAFFKDPGGAVLGLWQPVKSFAFYRSRSSRLKAICSLACMTCALAGVSCWYPTSCNTP